MMGTILRWCFLGFLIMPVFNFAQLTEISINNLEKTQKQDPRNTVLFIHTDWCQYCKAMLKTTFRNKDLVKLLSEEFYFVAINAEEKEDVSFNGKIFRYIPSGPGTGINEFAQSFFEGKSSASYPHLFILNPDYEIILELNGFINSSDLLKMLTETDKPAIKSNRINSQRKSRTIDTDLK